MRTGNRSRVVIINRETIALLIMHAAQNRFVDPAEFRVFWKLHEKFRDFFVVSSRTLKLRIESNNPITVDKVEIAFVIFRIETEYLIFNF